MNFIYRENDNNSFELYNTDVGDIYFSNIGAYKEAMEKFVLPSDINLKSKKQLKILDACYGMGFNSKSLVNYLYKNNYDANIEIDAVDIDNKIFAFSLFLMDKNINDNVHLEFGKSLLNQIDLNENIKKISGEKWIKPIVDNLYAKYFEFYRKKGIVLHKSTKTNEFLHNIYYQNQENEIKNFTVYFFEAELSAFLQNNKNKYDFIYHDAFSILKQPELWSTDILNNYYKLLKKGGKFLTYSNSRQVRRILSECGFEVIINTTGDRKQNGTIAIKK